MTAAWRPLLALLLLALGCSAGSRTTRHNGSRLPPSADLNDLDARVRHWTALERRYRTVAQRLSAAKRFGAADNLLVVSKTVFEQLVAAVTGRRINRGNFQFRLAAVSLRYDVGGVFFSARLEVQHVKRWVAFPIDGYFRFAMRGGRVVARFVPLTLTIEDTARLTRTTFSKSLTIAALPRTLPQIPLPIDVSKFLKGARGTHRVTMLVADDRVMVVDQNVIIPFTLSVL